eukprot:scaffold37386_cov17-Tisochrysis_lutea.AAC.1
MPSLQVHAGHRHAMIRHRCQTEAPAERLFSKECFLRSLITGLNQALTGQLITSIYTSKASDHVPLNALGLDVCQTIVIADAKAATILLPHQSMKKGRRLIARITLGAKKQKASSMKDQKAKAGMTQQCGINVQRSGAEKYDVEP